MAVQYTAISKAQLADSIRVNRMMRQISYSRGVRLGSMAAHIGLVILCLGGGALLGFLLADVLFERLGWAGESLARALPFATMLVGYVSYQRIGPRLERWLATKNRLPKFAPSKASFQFDDLGVTMGDDEARGWYAWSAMTGIFLFESELFMLIGMTGILVPLPDDQDQLEELKAILDASLSEEAKAFSRSVGRELRPA